MQHDSQLSLMLLTGLCQTPYRMPVSLGRLPTFMTYDSFSRLKFFSVLLERGTTRQSAQISSEQSSCQLPREADSVAHCLDGGHLETYSIVLRSSLHSRRSLSNCKNACQRLWHTLTLHTSTAEQHYACPSTPDTFDMTPRYHSRWSLARPVHLLSSHYSATNSL